MNHLNFDLRVLRALAGRINIPAKVQYKGISEGYLRLAVGRNWVKMDRV
jgi:hypothetical protein